MQRKFYAIAISALMAASMVGCGKNDEKKVSTASFKNSEITIITDRKNSLDRKYVEDPEIAINYIPSKKKYTEEDATKIAGSVDKHTKVLVIDVEGSGLLKVFDQVKSKLPGVITVGNNIGEFDNDGYVDILKNSNVNSALKVDEVSGMDIAKSSITMGAKILIVVNGDNEFVNDAKEFSLSNGIKNFYSVDVSKNSSLNAIEKAISEKAGGEKDVALYSSDDNISAKLFEIALKNKYIIPDLDTENDGEIVQGILGSKLKSISVSIPKRTSEIISSEKLANGDKRENSDSDEKEEVGANEDQGESKKSEDVNSPDDKSAPDRAVFDKKFEKYLSSIGMSGRIGMVYEGKKEVPTESIIAVAKFMYENSYMIEECYRDVSLIDRGNRQLDLSIEPVYLDNSIGYVRALNILPRVY